MQYGRKRFNMKRRSFRKRRFQRKGVRPELKYLDTDFNGLNTTSLQGNAKAGTEHIGTARTMVTLNNIIQGMDNNERIGREILIKSVEIKATVTLNDTATPEAGPLANARLVLLWDLQPNGSATTPTLDTIFEANTETGTVAPITSNNLMNLNYKDRFVVLWNKKFTIGNVSGGTSAGDSCKVVKMYRKLWLKTRYQGTGAGIGAIATGRLFLVCIGDSPTAGGSKGAQVFGNARIRFVDP